MITKAAETEALKTVKTEEKPVLQTEKRILPGQPEAYSEVKGRIIPAARQTVSSFRINLSCRWRTWP